MHPFGSAKTVGAVTLDRIVWFVCSLTQLAFPIVTVPVQICLLIGFLLIVEVITHCIPL